jgi:hypothetical protein
LLASSHHEGRELVFLLTLICPSLEIVAFAVPQLNSSICQVNGFLERLLCAKHVISTLH